MGAVQLHPLIGGQVRFVRMTVLVTGGWRVHWVESFDSVGDGAAGLDVCEPGFDELCGESGECGGD